MPPDSSRRRQRRAVRVQKRKRERRTQIRARTRIFSVAPPCENPKIMCANGSHIFRLFGRRWRAKVGLRGFWANQFRLPEYFFIKKIFSKYSSPPRHRRYRPAAKSGAEQYRLCKESTDDDSCILRRRMCPAVSATMFSSQSQSCQGPPIVSRKRVVSLCPFFRAPAYDDNLPATRRNTRSTIPHGRTAGFHFLGDSHGTGEWV